MKIILILLIAITISTMPAIAQESSIEKGLKNELRGQVMDQVKEPLTDAVGKIGEMSIKQACSEDLNSYKCKSTRSTVSNSNSALGIILFISSISAVAVWVKR